MTKTKSASDKKKGGKDKDPPSADPKSLGSYTIPKVGQKDSTKATRPKSPDPAVVDPVDTASIPPPPPPEGGRSVRSPRRSRSRSPVRRN